jgi:hypothetical protein
MNCEDDQIPSNFSAEPRVYYKNLYRFSGAALGTVLQSKEKATMNVLRGSRVTLIKGSNTIGEAETDNYGDFKFDNLEENSGRYTLEIAYPNYEKKAVAVNLTTSLDVGSIWL